MPLKQLSLLLITALGLGCAQAAGKHDLWSVYQQHFKSAKYIDLTHTIRPDIPVWAGFGPSSFAPAVAGAEIEQFATQGEPFTYPKHGFEATRYNLATDQLGTQLDPPAHWSPDYPAIDELPATYTLRPLVVISIVDQVKKNYGYALQVADILQFEARHGKIPQAPLFLYGPTGPRSGPIQSLPPVHPFPV